MLVFRASTLWNVSSVTVQPSCCLLKEYVTKKQRSCYSAVIAQIMWEENPCCTEKPSWQDRLVKIQIFPAIFV